MAGGEVGGSMSPKVAFVFVFNLIIGLGALNLPSGFQAAGIVPGVLLLAVLGFLSYISITWLVEAQGVANAIMRVEKQRTTLSIQAEPREVVNRRSSLNEQSPLVLQRDHSNETLSEHLSLESKLGHSIFEITERVELALMSELFFARVGQIIYYIIISVYLFGDLAIYAVGVPKSLATIVAPNGLSMGSIEISADGAYYLFLGVWSLIVIPFTWFNFQKTRYLQYATLAVRNVALFMMIVMAIVVIADGKGLSKSEVVWFDVSQLPALIGVSIYSFMCHHSLPSIVTPINDKRHLSKLFAADIIVIYSYYVMLCVTAVFAFPQITSLYTLSFRVYPIVFNGLSVFTTFLGLFPVFTLTANFPLIAITLRNNLMQLIKYGEHTEFQFTRRIMFSFLAAGPPILIAFIVQDLSLLVQITGSYAGLAIMFILPALFVIFGRRRLNALGITDSNPYESPFSNFIWQIIILIIAAGVLPIVTWNIVMKIKNG